MHIRRNIKIFTWFYFFSAFKFYSAFAIIYFTQITNSVALGISIISIAQIANAALEIPTGFLSDKLGRKPILFLGAIARLFSCVCYAIGYSYPVLVAGALLEGLAMSLFSGNNEALLYDSINQAGEKHKYHSYLGKVKSMAYPPLVIASLIGGLLATRSFSLVFWITTIPQTICVVLTLLITEPKSHKESISETKHQVKEAIKLLYNNIQLRRISIAEVLTQGIDEILFQLQLLFYNTLWPVWAVGITRSIMALGKFISFRYSSKLIDRFGATTMLIFNTVITRVIHILSLVFPSIASPLFMTSTGFLWGTIEVSKSKLLQEQFTNAQRATMYSVLGFLASIFAGIIGMLVGLVSERFGVINTLLILQLTFVPILGLYMKLHRSQR